MAEDPYHRPLTRAIKAEEAYESEASGLADLMREFDGLTVTVQGFESASGPGIIVFRGVWRGQTVSEYSIPALRAQLALLRMRLDD